MHFRTYSSLAFDWLQCAVQCVAVCDGVVAVQSSLTRGSTRIHAVTWPCFHWSILRLDAAMCHTRNHPLWCIARQAGWFVNSKILNGIFLESDWSLAAAVSACKQVTVGQVCAILRWVIASLALAVLAQIIVFVERRDATLQLAQGT